MAVQLASSLVVIGPCGEIIAVFHRRHRALERQDVQAVPRQIEITNDFGTQQAYDIGKHRELEAGKDLFRHGGTADPGPALEHQHLFPGARQIGGRHEAVVASADHDRVVAHYYARLRSGLKKGSAVT